MNEDYFRVYREYTATYGKKTALWYQVGSFFELFDEVDTRTGESKTNVRELAELLGLQISTKKDIAPNTDEIFAGIPEHTIDRWAGKLTSLGWTSVLVEQVKDHRGKIAKRVVSRILSPSTHIENLSSTDIPYLFVITFTRPSALSVTPYYGAAVLDLSTGTTCTYSGTATGRQDAWVADELAQMMAVYPAKEIVLVLGSTVQQQMDEVQFRRQFGVGSTVPVHLRTIDSDHHAFSKSLVRTEYLQRIFPIRSLLPPRAYLGLRTDAEEHALLHLLQFTEDHYPTMVKSFQRNQPWQPHTRLVCGNHALHQLQMTGPQASECVLGLFDKAITPMGRRMMQERLLRPYSNASEIQCRLDEVAQFLTWPAEHSVALEKHLRFMYDLPRLHRRLLCGLITFPEIAHLFQTYRAMEVIATDLTPNTPLAALYTVDQWTAYMATFRLHFDEVKTMRLSCDQTAFSAESYPTIADKEAEIQHTIQEIDALRKEVARIGKVPEEAIRLEEREKEPYGFKMSSVTLQQLKKNIAHLPSATKFNELKSGGWMDCMPLQTLNGTLLRLREQLLNLVQRYVVMACSMVSEEGRDIWPMMEQWISLVDCTQCIARVSTERGYTCPTLCTEDGNGGDGSGDGDESFLEIEQMRHPLVEQLASKTTYVKHDVSLTPHTDRGWLLYALNGVGKSVLMKAVGLCVLLAQAGCYVPAKRMTLRPFTAIYTRILNNDNLFQGLSSFSTEMGELRDILQYSNARTLVLGDELSSGTESISGQAIVTASIQWLAKRRSKFIFATHLHDVPSRLDPKKDRIGVWHLHVEYDPVTQKLVYDRTLRPGSGSTLYGIEVARALDLPREFIDHALAIRHQILGSTTQQAAKPSAWNSSVVRRACERCGHPVVRDLEVHHVRHRADADATGHFADGSDMNAASNLMVICQACHDALHRGEFTVGPVVQTSHGPERQIVEPKEPVSESKEPAMAVKRQGGKWTDAEVEQVKETLRMYPSLALKSIRAFLSSAHGIEMSESVLSRLRKEL